MTQEEPKEDKAFDSIEQLSKIAQDLVRRKTELAQRTWVEMTDEELRKLADKHLYYQPEGYVVSGVFDFARAIEAKLKEKNT